MGSVEATILKAATKLFEKRGLEDVSVQDICREAAVNRTTFYRHFKSKNEVLSAIMPAKFKKLMEVFVENLGTEGSYTERLIEALAPILHEVDTDPLLSAYAKEAFTASKTDRLSQIRTRFVDSIQNVAVGLLQKSNDSGEAYREDPEATVAVCTAMIFGWCSQPKALRTVTNDRFCEAMKVMLINAHKTSARDPRNEENRMPKAANG